VILEIQEKIFFYKKAQLVAWKNGDKSLTPDFLQDRSSFLTQPDYSFGEVFALNHYHETEGWHGFLSYALGFQYPHSQARANGRKKVEEIIPIEKLARFRQLRGKSRETDFGTGEPDLFLYKNTGEYKFAEVKKQTDRMRPSQFKCLAQIVAGLECQVEVIYLCEEGHAHAPKIYLLDLENFTGSIKPRE